MFGKLKRNVEKEVKPMSEIERAQAVLDKEKVNQEAFWKDINIVCDKHGYDFQYVVQPVPVRKVKAE